MKTLRIIDLKLVFLIGFFICWNATAFASCDDSGPYSGGDGSSSSPYQLSTVSDIQDLASVSHTDIDDCNYELVNDIVFPNGSSALNPIGGSGTSNSAARITLNGNHFTIKGVNVNNNGNNVGFFGKLYNSSVRNLSLDSITVSSSGTVDLGGLAGEISGSTIDSVTITGQITHTQSSGSASMIGGLAGFVQSNSNITSSSFNGSIDATNRFSGSATGGLVGHLSSSSLSYSYVIADTIKAGKIVGGLVGKSHNDIFITESFSKGVISINSSTSLTDYIGGLVGEMSAFNRQIIIKDTYSRVRIRRNGHLRNSRDYSTGLVGYWNLFTDINDTVRTSYASVRGVYSNGFTGSDRQGEWINNFYDSDSSGKSDTEGATPLTSLQLQDQTNLTGFDFDDVWASSDSYNDGFPYFQWEFTATPDQATLSSPADGATGQSIAPTLEWGTAAQATAYTVQVSTDNFTSTVVNQSTASTSLDVSGLEYSTTYQWRVQATNDAGNAAWSSTRTFTTGAPAIPGAPSLSSPADGADSVDASATLQWASSSNATGYDVQVSTDGFATTVVNSSTSSTSLSASLDWSTSYSWRVRATNQSGSSDWSEARDFTTRAVPVPDPPALSFPAEGATGLAADSVLQWAASTYATGYDLEVSTSATFATTVVSTSTTERSMSPSLGWSSTYYWRVRATNGSGESDWSEAKSFSTRAIPLPGSPTVTGGSDCSGGGDDSDSDPDNADPDSDSRSAIPTQVPVDTTLTWTPGEYATQYRIQVSADTFATFAHNTTVGRASFTVNLDYLTRYQWRVRSVNNSGQSPWSDTLAFITQVPPVKQIPASAMNPDKNTMHAPLNPTLQWQAMPHAEAYHLEVSADSFATTMMNATTADTAHPIEGLAYEHRYHWRVRATNATGDGPWSEPVGFRTQLPPVQATTMRAPQQNGTDVEIPTTFEWAPVEKATTYEFMLFTDDMLTEVLATHTTDTSITIDTLDYDREYLARVRPKNVTSAGPWRSVEFKTVVNGLATSNEGAGSGDGTGADAIPTSYDLEQNYPNPFNPSTVIRYALPQAGEVQLELYDMMGRKVSTLVRGTKSAGYHEVVFDASHLGSGAYMYRLVAGDVVLARTLYLIK